MKLSIVSINYNNAEGLKKTAESITAQTYTDYEWIIIDGGSTDDSIEIIKEHANKINYWVSEKDRGIYHAQNKGTEIAKGEYILYLNSGDSFADDGVLENVLPYLNGTDIVYGDLIIAETNKEWVKKYDDPLSFHYFTKDTLPHQASFISRNIINKTGAYDEALKICSDWKFFLDAVCKQNATTFYLNRIISKYDYTGLSSEPKNHSLLLSEKKMILEKDYRVFFEEFNELLMIKQKYNLLTKSRIIKVYFKIKKLAQKRK